MLAVAEHFSVERSRTKLAEWLPLTPAFLAEAATALDRRVDSNWADRRGAWKRWFGIETAGVDPDAELRPFIEARNSLLHGGGALTQLQRANARQVFGLFNRAGLVTVSGILIINTANVRDCAQRCRNFILWLDEALAVAVALP